MLVGLVTIWIFRTWRFDERELRAASARDTT